MGDLNTKMYWFFTAIALISIIVGAFGTIVFYDTAQTAAASLALMIAGIYCNVEATQFKLEGMAIQK